MNYAILTEELSTDPLERGYAEMTDVEVATSLNTADVTVRQLVPLWRVKKTAIEEGCWLPIQAAAASHETPAVQGAAMIAIDYINDQRFENLDMDLPSTQQMLGALVAGGVISAEQSATLDALADSTTSRASQLGIGRVGAGHVESARSRI